MGNCIYSIKTKTSFLRSIYSMIPSELRWLKNKSIFELKQDCRQFLLHSLHFYTVSNFFLVNKLSQCKPCKCKVLQFCGSKVFWGFTGQKVSCQPGRAAKGTTAQHSEIVSRAQTGALNLFYPNLLEATHSPASWLPFCSGESSLSKTLNHPCFFVP